MSMMSLISISQLRAGYGKVPVLHGVCLSINPGEIISLLGPNGAGKTTLLRTLSGTANTLTGSVRFGDIDLLAQSAYKRAGMGIAHVPEGRKIINSMTIIENLQLGAYPPHATASFDTNLDLVWRTFPILREFASQPAARLSGGQQQMLAIGRGIMAAPKFLMLDEPSAGLSPLMVSEVYQGLKLLREQTGVAVLLVEQQVAPALALSDRTLIIEGGEIVKSFDSSRDASIDQIINEYFNVGE